LRKKCATWVNAAAGPLRKLEKRAVVLPTKPQARRKSSRVRMA
jgi:hypothetical protein